MKTIAAIILVFLAGGCVQSQKPPTYDILKLDVCRAPGSIEIADFNKDNLPDLAVTSETDSSVSVLLGAGNGKFYPARGSPFFAGHIPNDIAIADLNRDGNPDLVFANHERKQLTVLLGIGAGAFAQSPHSPLRTWGVPHTHGVATGDFNGDGVADLVTDSWGNDQLEILFGDTMQSFKERKFVQVGRRPYQRARVHDLNNDSLDDIVATNLESNNVTVLLSDGRGNFSQPDGSPFECGDAPFGIATGDVNNDGRIDLAIVNSPSSTAENKGINGLTVLLGTGGGRFARMNILAFPAGKIPNRVAIGDVDGDGINDIVTSDGETDKIYLFITGHSKKELSGIPIEVGSHPKGLALADLNNDSKADIVVCNNGDNSVFILLSK